MRIITISGIDGSGKSTQINLLKNYLESQGKKVFYFHAVQHGIVKKLQNFKSAKPRSEPGSATGVVQAGWLKIQLRKFALLADMKRLSMQVKKLEKEGYDYLLSDRYFFDSVINLKYLAKKLDASVQDFLKYRLNEIKPDLALYLKTDPEIIMQRDRKPDQGLEYLQAKNKLYNTAAFIWNMKTIDGNRDKEEIFNEIKSFL